MFSFRGRSLLSVALFIISANGLKVPQAPLDLGFYSFVDLSLPVQQSGNTSADTQLVRRQGCASTNQITCTNLDSPVHCCKSNEQCCGTGCCPLGYSCQQGSSGPICCNALASLEACGVDTSSTCPNNYYECASGAGCCPNGQVCYNDSVLGPACSASASTPTTKPTTSTTKPNPSSTPNSNEGGTSAPGRVQSASQLLLGPSTTPAPADQVQGPSSTADTSSAPAAGNTDTAIPLQESASSIAPQTSSTVAAPAAGLQTSGSQASVSVQGGSVPSNSAAASSQVTRITSTSALSSRRLSTTAIAAGSTSTRSASGSSVDTALRLQSKTVQKYCVVVAGFIAAVNMFLV